MKQLFILFPLVLYSAIASTGTYINGSQLLKGCEINSQDKMWFFCWGHIERAIYESGNKSLEEPAYCIPNEVTSKRLHKIVITYLNKHPEDLHYAAHSLVQLAMLEAFPCPELADNPG